MCYPNRENLRVLLVSRDQTSALMRNKNGQWDFPLFEFRKDHFDHLLLLGSKLSNIFGVDRSKHFFTPVVELIGYYTARTLGRAEKIILSTEFPYSHLVWMEWHMDSIEVPEGWEWKDASFIKTLLMDQNEDNTFEIAINRAIHFLNEEVWRTKKLWQPRHQAGWFEKSSTWLRAVVEKNGGVICSPITHVRVSFLSTVLKAESTNGAFFLKAPNAGSGEVQLTEAIQMVMPERTLEVVALNKQLGCFVSKAFETISLYGGDTLPYGENPVVHSSMLKALGEMHVESLEHKERLLEAGVPQLGIPELIDEVEKLLMTQEHHKQIQEFVPEIKRIIPRVIARLRRLGRYKIPLVLVHGDFSDENCGMIQDMEGGKRLILHDWMFAAISHPFFDFVNFETSEAQRDEYLRTWVEYESLERCREAFELAEPMGWLVKLFVFLKCYHASDPQMFSENLHFGYVAHWRHVISRILQAEEAAAKGTG